MYKQFSLFLILITGTLFPLFTFSQTTPQVEVFFVPPPRAGERFTARIESFDIDLTQATIRWQYEGKTVASGVGITSTSLIAPGAGKSATLAVSVRSLEGNAQVVETIRPEALDIIWESPDTYTPPFYKGKGIPAPGATLRVVGIPFSGAPVNTVFTWTYNDSVVQSQSGVRRNVLTLFTNDLTIKNEVGLKAQGGTFSAEASLSVPWSDPQIIAYKKADGFIDYVNGFTRDLSLTESGTTLRFEPYGFTKHASLSNSFVSEISLGGEIVSPQNLFNELPLSRPNESGTNVVRVIIQSLKHSFQSQERSFTVSF